MPDGRDRYRALIEKEARSAGLAPEIAEAVMAVESGYNPGAIGGAGEIGLMQIMPPTARLLGFGGTLADLAVPETNIHYGVMYLAQAWRLARRRPLYGRDEIPRRPWRDAVFLSLRQLLPSGALEAVCPRLSRDWKCSGCDLRRGWQPRRGYWLPTQVLGGGQIGNVNIASLNMRLADLVVQARRGH